MSILSARSDIHPSYYAALGVDVAATSSPIGRQRLTFGQIVRIGELVALLSVSALAISKLYATEKTVIVSSPPAASATTEELEARLNQIGEILDYVIQKVTVPSPTPSPERERAKVCRVSVPKALLRTGPGKNFSPLLALDINSELLVQDETEGWFQVIAPTGQPAWVSREVVTL